MRVDRVCLASVNDNKSGPHFKGPRRIECHLSFSLLLGTPRSRTRTAGHIGSQTRQSTVNSLPIFLIARYEARSALLPAVSPQLVGINKKNAHVPLKPAARVS